jgi:hypothetical protein
MKTGMHTLPHTNLRRPALIWYSKGDQDLTEALKLLASTMQGIKQLVIVVEQEKASYATKQLISWFMSQKYDRNVKMVTCLKHVFIKHQDGTESTETRAVTKAVVAKRTPRNYVDQLVLKVLIPNAPYQPKDYFRMYLLTPQMHIFPSTFTDRTSMNNSYPIVDSWGTGQASASSDYDYYKMVMSQVEAEWSPSHEAKPLKEFIPTDYAMFRPLCEAYELDPSDDHAWEQLEYYVISKEPIVRLPRDEEIYAWFMELGIAPAYSDINSGTSIFDDAHLTSIGKEAILDEMREFNEADLLPEFYK